MIIIKETLVTTTQPKLSLIEELKQKSDLAANTSAAVTEEIKAFYGAYFMSSEFETYIRSIIKSDEIARRQIHITVSFWEYIPGCSNTGFHAAGKNWRINSEDHGSNYKYKGVELKSVHNDVCSWIADKLVTRMKQLGFTSLGEEVNKSRFNFFDKRFYFGW